MTKRKASNLTIEFANAAARRHFALWLCESGEQSYWDWMEAREEEEDGDITAVCFNYHGKEPPPPGNAGQLFVADGVIRTKCGRLGR